jgi:hypothetical protein
MVLRNPEEDGKTRAHYKKESGTFGGHLFSSVMNFRGENARITMVPIFPEGDERNKSSPAGFPGKYKITFILSRPRYVMVSESVHKWADAVKGDSHLGITRPAITPKSSPDAVAIKVRAWSRRRLFGVHRLSQRKGFLGSAPVRTFRSQ